MKKTNKLIYICCLLVTTFSLNIWANDSLPASISRADAIKSWHNQTNSFQFNSTQVSAVDTATNSKAVVKIIVDDKGNIRVIAFGDYDYGGVIDGYLEQLLIAIQPDRINASGKAFIALNSVTGMAVFWGKPQNQETYIISTLSEITDVFSSANGFAVILNNVDYIQEISNEGVFSNVEVSNETAQDPIINIYHSGGEVGAPSAWLAVTLSGRVDVWGNEEAGGKLPSEISNILQSERVKNAYSNASSFVVETRNGNFVSWGGSKSPDSGADIPINVLEKLNQADRVQLYANKLAYAGLADGQLVAWGNAQCGAEITGAIYTAVSSMSSPLLNAGNCSFIVHDTGADSTGLIFEWGKEANSYSNYDGDQGIKVFPSSKGTVITDSSRYLTAWGDGELSSQALNVMNLGDIDQLIASSNAFASVVSLGNGMSIINSWVSGVDIFDTLSCYNGVDLYSTQAASEDETTYFLAYHPNCSPSSEKNYSTWISEGLIKPAIEELHIAAPNGFVISAGNTITGSYLYISNLNIPEGQSIKQWRISASGQVIKEELGTAQSNSELELSDLSRYAGELIEFCVTPIDSTGRQGNETCEISNSELIMP